MDPEAVTRTTYRRDRPRIHGVRIEAVARADAMMAGGTDPVGTSGPRLLGRRLRSRARHLLAAGTAAGAVVRMEFSR